MSDSDKKVSGNKRAKLSAAELQKRKEARETMRLSMKDWSPEKRLAYRADKFRTVGNRRINQVVRGIELLANLANKSNYHAETEQIGLLLGHLRAAVDKVELAFAKVSKTKEAIKL